MSFFIYSKNHFFKVGEGVSHVCGVLG